MFKGPEEMYNGLHLKLNQARITGKSSCTNELRINYPIKILIQTRLFQLTSFFVLNLHALNFSIASFIGFFVQDFKMVVEKAQYVCNPTVTSVSNKTIQLYFWWFAELSYYYLIYMLVQKKDYLHLVHTSFFLDILAISSVLNQFKSIFNRIFQCYLKTRALRIKQCT